MVAEIAFDTVVRKIDALKDITLFRYITMNPFLTNLLRPAFIIVQVDSLRDSFERLYYVVKDSGPIVLYMLANVTFFAFLGERMFIGTLEGATYFFSFKESWANMFILMTTCNFPDVMLPAYKKDRIWCLFFVIYVILQIYLLMSLMLAIFYSNFNKR